MSFEFPRPGLPATEDGTSPLNRHWLQWLRQLARDLFTHTIEGSHVPVGSIVFVTAETAASETNFEFGRGVRRWNGWAVCDGANNRPAVTIEGKAVAVMRVA